MVAGLFLLAAAALVACGLWIVVQASKAKRELLKYEFENRTDGGVVRFANHEASLAHGRRHYVQGALLKTGAFMVGIGAILMPFALVGMLAD